MRLATLATSSHNTQCWRFETTARAIEIIPDLSRRCPVLDPDEHHLFVSLGCAVENLTYAALAHGLKPSTRFDRTRNDAIEVEPTPTTPTRTQLFAAISERQCTRAPYDRQALTTLELRRLSDAGTGSGVHVLLLTDRPAIERVLARELRSSARRLLRVGR